MTIRLLRTLRLDVSDSFVFETAAAPGEWAVPGSFMFWSEDIAALTGKRRQAFRSGFLGLTSFGWSTLAMVCEASDEEREEAVRLLAGYLREHHGAPDDQVAQAAAREEIAFMESLADHPPQTVIALTRRLDDKGEIGEQFRTLHRATTAKGDGLPCSAGAFFAVEAHEAVPAGEDADFSRLMRLSSDGSFSR